ncbi:GNAT family N-acetyltransferase [Abyssisolibacter fermentans]|uniref:GNAT family N-acetyltransferase n=1 Tax=Abyssisolibacter fermentans TaxID=1766203 RepID=UPI00082B6BE3|nr:GNAT family N-acetyltransferase [Abyssisolibacter fermentans]
MVKFIEELSMNALPALNTIFYDGWIIRISKDYSSKRASSVYAMYPSIEDIKTKITRCENIYTKQDKKVVFKISEDDVSLELDRILEEKGYNKEAVTCVMDMDLDDNYAYDENIKIEKTMYNGWLDNFIQLSKKSKTEYSAIKKLYENLVLPVICVSIFKDARCIATGLGIIERGYVGIFNVYVSEDNRRKGLATEIMMAILNQAKKNGVEKSYLQVVRDNVPAKKLYEQLGYNHIYNYWYRIREEL